MVADLEAFRNLAVSIERNAKGDALLSALDRAFAEANRLGLVANGEIVPVFSAAQVEQVRMAGMRAAQGSPVAQSAAVTVTN